jgi:formylmethanofuran dehydrogenase subunit B
VIRRGENDAMLVVGSDPMAHFPKGVANRIRSLPLAAVDPVHSVTTMFANIVIPSAFAGIESEGIAYRMDGVALPLKKLVDPPQGVLSDEEVLQKILDKVRELKGRSE